MVTAHGSRFFIFCCDREQVPAEESEPKAEKRLMDVGPLFAANAVTVRSTYPPRSAYFIRCSVLNKVECHLESLIHVGNLRSRKGPNVMRKIGLTKTNKVVTHDPA